MERESSRLGTSHMVSMPSSGFGRGFVSAIGVIALILIGYFGARLSQPSTSRALAFPTEFLHAAATHGAQNMAIATGSVSDDSEGIFFLDYATGNLQCWVYYPRTGTFGAKFLANVSAQIPGGKNPEYLMVTGGSAASGSSSNTRAANCIVYVMNVHEGTFAAYGVPWNASHEKSAQIQTGALIPVGGGHIRDPQPGNR